MIDTLLRQWILLHRLPRHPRQLEPARIKDKLDAMGIAVTLRTVQRDLNTLALTFPLAASSGQSDSISVFLYLPFRVKTAHYPEACMLVNAIKADARHGHLEIVAESGRIRLVVSDDVEGANPTGVFVMRMLQCVEAILSH